MSNIEKRIDAVCAYLLAEDPVTRDKARAKLLNLMDSKPTGHHAADPETITREIFLELGAPDHLQGHEYAITGICLVVESRTFIDNITFGLYPAIAAKHDTTAARTERAIRHLIEVIFTRCDYSVLNKYFGNSISADRGKPTNGEFIARISNVVKMRMNSAA